MTSTTIVKSYRIGPLFMRMSDFFLVRAKARRKSARRTFTLLETARHVIWKS